MERFVSKVRIVTNEGDYFMMDIYPFCVVILIGNTNFYHIDQDFENVKIILDYYYNSFSFDSTNYADWFILKVLKRVFILD